MSMFNDGASEDWELGDAIRIPVDLDGDGDGDGDGDDEIAADAAAAEDEVAGGDASDR